MDFFERQRTARADTRRLLALFAVAVVAIVAAVVAIVAFLLYMNNDERGARAHGFIDVAQLQAPTLVAVALITLAVIAVASLVKAAQLRQGGAAVARSLGGTEIPAQTRDLNHQRLRNVVEEVAIASGVPVPQIFVLENEPGINAFAAGFSPSDAAIAVTRGTLESLNRDELQGVIAHEYSHILNGDMRLNLRLIGWLAGITLLALIGRILMRARGRNSGGIVLFGLALLLIGSVGLLCARLIKAGISRKREYLADASAVQFTRQTQGIAGALKQIAAKAQGSKLAATDGEEVSHLLFGDGVGYSRLFATHPPLEARIRALEPSFKMTDLTAWIGERRRVESSTTKKKAQQRPPLPDIEFTRVLGGAGQPIPAPVIIAGLAADASAALDPREVIRQVGSPAEDDYRTAELLHERFPPELDEAAHAPEQAPAVLAGLLMSSGSVGDREIDSVRELLGDEILAQASGHAEACAALHPMQRLPLAEIAFGALRRLPAERLERTREIIDALVAVDRNVSLFEYCLGYLLRQQIDETLWPNRVRSPGRRSLKASEGAVGALLSVLASRGQVDTGDAPRAFAAGVSELGHGIAPRYAPPFNWVAALDNALPELDRLKPQAKSLLVAAMTRTVMHDDRIDVAEAELLRTACAALHCPLPPLLHEGRTRLAAPPTVE